MQKKLTRLQTYSAILRFLNFFYAKSRSENLSDFITYAFFWSDGKTADEAAWLDWLEVLEKTMLQDTTLHNTNRMTHAQATHAMLNYFQYYCSFYKQTPDDMAAMLTILQQLHTGGEKNEWWPVWQKAIEDTVSLKDPRYYIKIAR